MTVQQRVEWLRTARGGRSNGDIARVAGVDHSYISRVMSGERVPSIEVCIKLARALNIQVGVMVMVFEPEPTPRGAR